MADTARALRGGGAALYNDAPMRAAFSLSLMLTLTAGSTLAQNQGQNGIQANESGRKQLSIQEQTSASDGRIQQRTERLQHEDRGSRIDELRVGGTTRSIAVQPKNSEMPAYDVQPQGGERGNLQAPRTGSDGTAGNRVWNMMKF